MITTIDLIKAINQRIRNSFKGISISNEDINEGFVRPSFKVHLEDTSPQNFNCQARFSTTNFSIYYRPKDRHENLEENLNIMEKLEKSFIFNRLLEIENQGNVEIKFKSLKIVDKVVALRISISLFQKYELPAIEQIEDIEGLEDIKLGGNE